MHARCVWSSFAYCSLESRNHQKAQVKFVLFDFSINRGSLLLNIVEREGRNRQSIRIVGPEDPFVKPEVVVEHVQYDAEGKESTRVLNPSEIRAFVTNRILSEPDISEGESGFLAALLLHSSGSAQIKIWGVSGWRHLKNVVGPSCFGTRSV